MADVTDRLAALLVALAHDPTLHGQPLAEQFGSLVDRLQANEITEVQFQELAQSALAGLYTNSYTDGLQEVAGPGAELTNASLDHIEALVREQEPYLADFGAAVVASTGSMDYAQRAQMYEDSAHRAYQTGALAGAIEQGLITEIGWNAEEDDETCDPCQEAAAGSPYGSPDELPGLPGYPFCDGGNNCRCTLSFR